MRSAASGPRIQRLPSVGGDDDLVVHAHADLGAGQRGVTDGLGHRPCALVAEDDGGLGVGLGHPRQEGVQRRWWFSARGQGLARGQADLALAQADQDEGVAGVVAEQVRQHGDQVAGAAHRDRGTGGHGGASLPWEGRCPNVCGHEKRPATGVAGLQRGGFSSPVLDVVIPTSW